MKFDGDLARAIADNEQAVADAVAWCDENIRTSDESRAWIIGLGEALAGDDLHAIRAMDDTDLTCVRMLALNGLMQAVEILTMRQVDAEENER